jgi:hypothetical protein
MKSGLTVLMLALVCCASQAPSRRGNAQSMAAASMERKLRRIESLGSSAHPQPTRTELSEEEINAYFAAGKIDLPAGVESVRFESEPGVVKATTRVDFERIKAGRSSFNTLLEVFRGVHDVDVVAHAHAAGGVGYVEVDSVSLDGVEIPRFVLQLFVANYIQPKYPNLGLDSSFRLPDRIDQATVGVHELTVTQK